MLYQADSFWVLWFVIGAVDPMLIDPLSHLVSYKTVSFWSEESYVNESSTL